MNKNSQNLYHFVLSVTTDVFSEPDQLRPEIESVVSLFLQGEYTASGNHISGFIDYSPTIMNRVHDMIIEQSLPIRIAIARNSALSEIAQLWGDADGVTFISPEHEDTYLAGIPVGELPEVSRSTATQLRKFQVFTAYDIKYSNKTFLSQNCSSYICGLHEYYNSEQNLNSAESLEWYKRVQSRGLLETYTDFIKSKSKANSIFKKADSTFEPINLFNYQNSILPSIT